MANKKYTFHVHKDANKEQIKEAVESLCTKGMLERQDSGLIKKAYAIKIN